MKKLIIIIFLILFYATGTTAQNIVLPASIDVSAIGAATYIIPIEVVPGTANMQPCLSIAYNSMSGRGIIGQQWSIQGISAITRTGKSLHYDNNVSPISFDTSDRYMLDGARMVCINNNYHASNALYAFEQDDHSRICKSGSGFIDTLFDGRLAEYGKTVDSRLVAGGYTLSWMLNRITDGSGNYMTYSYDQQNGEIRLTRIDYTGNSSASLTPYASVRFQYNNSSDFNNCYINGIQYQQSLLLNRIDIYYFDTLVRSYRFSYNPVDGKEYLRQINLHDKDGSLLSQTTVEWNTPTGIVSADSNVTGVGGGYRLVSGNFDNDRLYDFFSTNYTSGTPSQYITRLFKRGTNGQFSSISLQCQFADFADLSTMSAVDIDGDGIDEIMYQTSDSTHGVYMLKLSTAYGTTSTSQQLLYGNLSQPLVGDFDGDGILEVVAISNLNQLRCYGIDGLEDNVAYSLGKSFIQGLVGDFDGDGKSDLMLMCDGESCIYKYDVLSHVWQEAESTSITDINDVAMIGDFNGDGQSDILFRSNGSLWQVAMRKGPNQWGIAVLSELDTLRYTNTTGLQHIPFVIDADGDGRSDIMQESNYYIIRYVKLNGYYNNQLCYSVKSINKSSSQAVSSTTMSFGDFDGNGTYDLLFFNPQPGGAPATIKYLYPTNRSTGMVRKVTDAVGKELILEYSPISLMPSRHSATGRQWLQLPLVRNLLMSNGIGGYDTAQYYYGDARFEGMPRQFVGFQHFVMRSNRRMVEQVFRLLPKGDSANEHFDVNVPDTTNIYAVTALSVEPLSPYSALSTPWRSTSDQLISRNITINQSMYKTVAHGFTIYMPYTYRVYEIDFLRNTRRLTTTNMHSSLWIPQSQYITDYNQTGNDQWAYRETYGMSYTSTTLPNGVRKYQISSKRCNVSYNNNTTNVMRDTVYSTYSQGRLTRMVVKSNSGTSDTTKYSYNACGLVTKKTERPKGASARFTTFTYDATMRFVISESNTIGYTSHCSYNAATGKPKRKTDIRGLTTRYIYDEEGRPIQQNNPDGTHVYYDYYRYSGTDISHAVMRSIITPQANPSVVSYYDCLGRTILTQTSGQGYRDVEYDRRGQKTRETIIPYDTLNAVIRQYRSYTYDIYGRTTSETSHYENNTYTYHSSTYSSSDYLYYEQVNRKDNTFTKKYYDAAGRVVKVEDRGGTIDYKYKIIKQSGKYYLETLIIYNNDTTRIVADHRGRRVSLKDPNAGLTTTTYNGWGEVLTQTDANGNVTTLTYDAIGRIASRKTKAPSASATTYQYVYYDDNVDTSARCGQLWKVVEGSTIRHSFTYDNCGRVSSERRRILSTTYPHRYTYNSDGQLYTVQYPDGFKVRYIYSIYGEPESVQDVSTGEAIFFVDRRDNMRHITRAWYGNGTGVKYAYNEHGLPVLQQYGWRVSASPLRDTIGGGGGIIAPYNPSEHYDVSDFFAVNTFSYNTNGYLQTRSELNSGQQETYNYDNYGRLSSYNINNSTTYSFSYASNGNIVRNTIISNSLHGYLYESQKPNAVSTINFRSGSTSSAQCAVTYNAFNRPSQIEEDSDRLMLYYNYDGHLTHTRLLQNGTAVCTTYYVFKDYEKERFSGFSRYYGFVYFEGRPVAVRMRHYESAYTRDTMFYIQTDLLGSWERVLDEAGNVVQANHFDPWGNRMMASNWKQADTAVSHLFRRGFTGHEHYDRFRIINMGARLYDPVIARFFSPDPQVQFPYSTQSFNRYTYCNNNPVMYVDPDGESILLALLIGAVIGGSINLGIHISQGDVKNFGQGLMHFGIGAVGGALSVAMGVYGPQILTGFGQMTGMSWLAGAGGTLNTIWQIGHAVNAATTVAGMVTHPQNAAKILLGRFYYDEQGWHGLSQALTRSTWELPQTWLGYNVSQGRNALGWVDRVDYLGGATFSINDKMEKGFGGITLGSYINIGTSLSIEGDLRDNLEKYPTLMHEYGHSIDSQRWGLAYLLGIGIPSFVSAMLDGKIPKYNHDYFYTELIANSLASSYFWKYYNITWDDRKNPLP